MARPRSYSDNELSRAVSTSTSWRAVLRALGLAATSSASIRSVRRHADALGLDHSHFAGARRWTDAQLHTAVSQAVDWPGVLDSLGLADRRAVVTLRGHAARLGIDVTHLDPPAPEPTTSSMALTPDEANLRRSGSLLAAAWFSLCGYDISWPLEPARYDLVVTSPTDTHRIQVKTTTVRAGKSWTAWLSASGKSRRIYDPDEIDYFFVITAALEGYLIPSRVVGGLHAITLSAYRHHLVTEGFRLPT